MVKDYYWHVYDNMGNLLLTVRATTLAKATRLAYSEIAKVGKYGVRHPVGKLKLKKVQGMFENPGIPKDEWIPVHAVKFNSDGGVSLMGEVGGKRQANPSKFAKLVGELAEKGARTPSALAAWIGRRKYGKAKFQKMAARGRRKHNPTNYYVRGKAFARKLMKLERTFESRHGVAMERGRLRELFDRAAPKYPKVEEHKEFTKGFRELYRG